MVGVPLHYRFDGPRHAPVVLLVPPPGTKWSMWEPQMPDLTRSARVLRVNLRGHGASPAPEGAYTVAEMGRDILDLLDECGTGRVALVAAGLGGPVATWIAAAEPDRVRRLAYVGGTAQAPFAIDWRAIGARVRQGGPESVVDEVTLSWFTPAFAERRPDVVTRMVEEFAGVSREGYAGYCDAIAGLDQRRTLVRVRAPTVVMSAAHDPLLPPRHGRRLAGGIGGARFEVVTGAAHLLNIERADRVNELLMEHVVR